MTRDGNVADVLVVLTSQQNNGRLLELHLEDGTSAELDIGIFQMMMTTSPAEFLSAMAEREK